MVLLTPRSASAVKNLTLLVPPDTHHCTCVSLSPSVGSRSSCRSQSSPVLACYWLCSFTSCRSAAPFFLGPWVPLLAVFHQLSSHPSRRSEPWLHHPSRCSESEHPSRCSGTDILLHVVLGYFLRTPCAVSMFLHASCGPWCFLSPHARPETAFTCCAWSGGLQHHHFSLPRAARLGRCLQSSAAPVVVS